MKPLIKIINWAERQGGVAPRSLFIVNGTIVKEYRTLPGQRVHTDKGGEFFNSEIDT